MNIPSILRHWFTLGATAATVWLASFLVLGPEDQATLTEAFSKLIEPLVAIAVLLIAALWRLVLAKAPTIFRRSSGTATNDGKGSGMVPMLAGLCMAAGVLGVLPSCNPNYPITGTVSYLHPATGAKAGLSYSPGAKLRGSVAVPIYDPATGKRTGYAELSTVNPSAK